MALVPVSVLLVRGGPDDGKSIPLAYGTLMIGRASLNDLVLDRQGISRQHACICGDEDGYWITDLRSRNGTYVNGERLGALPRLLRNFDLVELGGTDGPVHWAFMQSQSTLDIEVTHRDTSPTRTDLRSGTVGGPACFDPPSPTNAPPR